MSERNYDLSVVVPTFDMAEHLPQLARTLESTGLLRAAREVIFVDDGSTDATRAVLESIRAGAPDKIKILALGTNRGRYQARREGARAAAGGSLLFVDTRVALPDNFVTALGPMIAHGFAAATVRIDVSKSVFNLYWDRTHAFIFARNRRHEAQGFYIDADNFAEYVTGTTCFLTAREAFLDACAKFGDRDLRSDDTLLMKEIAAHHPIYVQSDWYILWEPRQTFGTFLWRLWDRGPGFAEYHVLTRRGLYFWVLVACFAYLAAGLGLAAVGRDVGWWLLLSIPSALALSTAVFSRSPVEFARMVPLHLATVAVCAAAAVWGTVVCLTERKDVTP